MNPFTAEFPCGQVKREEFGLNFFFHAKPIQFGGFATALMAAEKGMHRMGRMFQIKGQFLKLGRGAGNVLFGFGV